MKRQNAIQRQRAGLILLVVLGMLALFSLLAVTYVLFSGHSRSVSVALARSESRDSRSNWRPVFEEAVMQLVRGTRDENSVVFGHNLLGDLYGDAESLAMPAEIRVRSVAIISENPLQTEQMTFVDAAQTSDANILRAQRPMLLGGDFTPWSSAPPEANYAAGRFLRIPVDPVSVSVNLPADLDAWTGRVVTFRNGPLAGESFHIVRYIGSVPNSASAAAQAQRYSITIDLEGADLTRLHSQVDSFTGLTVTRTLAEWAFATAGTAPWTQGVYLCHGDIRSDGSLRDGYSIFVNPAPLNSHGPGIFADGTSQIHTLNPVTNTALDQMAIGLQPFAFDATTIGDSDEPYDAADYANMFLAHRSHSVSNPPVTFIDPSFHRAALISYIVNAHGKRLDQFTEADLHATLDRIELATGRVLSFNVQTPSRTRNRNPRFIGGNPALQLNLTVGSPWTTNWPTNGLPAFRAWLDEMTMATTRGGWDVDNDSDGMMDSIWVDIGLPLQQSPDGKLLKTLVAYYVDDLDKRLDVNATGNAPQADLAGVAYSLPTATPSNYAVGGNQNVAQGLGYGPADVSFRHLFSSNAAYADTMRSRYRRNPSFPLEIAPGDLNDDPLSLLTLRERRVEFRHGQMPGLPSAVNGRASYLLDRLGNVAIWNIDAFTNESTNDPYESRLLTSRHQDSPFTLAEWERLYRVGDSDRSNLPSRLQNAFGLADRDVAGSNLRHEITPISRHLRNGKFGTRARQSGTGRQQSFVDLIRTVADLKQITTLSDATTIAQLFPMEFSHGLPMNLNRAFGDGVDNNTLVTQPGFGEIDEPTELASGQNARYVQSVPPGNDPTFFTGDLEDYFFGLGLPDIYGQNAGQLNLDPAWRATHNPLILSGNETRQLFARHLYCLAQLIVPADYAFPNVDRRYFQDLLEKRQNGDTAAIAKYNQLRGRTLAQWAVNVVDFRDSDATMTRFPFDSTPFASNIWEPDGVVWGLEQPELLLTESLAFHDIRVRETRTEDRRMNQYRIPEGSLFLELFCPRATGQTAAQVAAGVPRSLYDEYSGQMRLNLSKMSPANSQGHRFPIWRVYVPSPHDRGSNLTHKTPHERLMAPSATSINQPSRNDLTYQLPSSNVLQGGPNIAAIKQQAGLVFDLSTNQPLLDPSSEARVIVFTNNFDPTNVNTPTPGVANAEYQVYYNRNAAVSLGGNEYMVIGPRVTTYLGSRRASVAQPPADGIGPDNAPSLHRIALGGGWASTYLVNGDLSRDPAAAGFPYRNSVVSMVAAANLPANWRSGSTVPVKDSVGINVSEPDPGPEPDRYYDVPTRRLNTSDMEADPATGAEGFGASPTGDAYHDFALPGPVPPKAPLDNGRRKPLSQWVFDPERDKDPSIIPGIDVIRPGTINDWSTAYLQRLADPNRSWDAIFNPYITVDWIPIDLTVFNGEGGEVRPDNDPFLPPTEKDAPGQIRLASRQKVGQLMNAERLEFDDAATAARGQSLLSLFSSTRESLAQPGDPRENFLKYALPLEVTRPNTPAPADGSASFTTLGFLSTHFNVVDATTVPNFYVGSPADPAGSNLNWHPENLFWANRQFVNPMEMAYVPLSSPGQLMQEFSAMPKRRYEASYRDASVPPANRGMPTSPRTAAIPDAAPPNGIPGGRTPASNAVNRNGVYASHLLNFFQEVPELGDPNQQLGYLFPHPKNTPLAMMMELVETPSPWVDAATVEPPGRFVARAPDTAYSNGLQSLVTANNQIFSTRRAPYNSVPRFVEPGRVNLNTVAEVNVYQGLWTNTLTTTADRTTPGSIRKSFPQRDLWQEFVFSRRGYVLPSNINPYYIPAGSGDRFNPYYPTEFAGLFKPVSEAGMVPRTRNPITTPTTPQEEYLQIRANNGVLDLHAREAPIQSTLMRSDMSQSNSEFVAPPELAATAARGIGLVDETVPLIRPPYETKVPPVGKQFHAFTDLYPMSRLANLTTDRSNTFAVYVTQGVFEYDVANDAIGVEYGADRGEVERAKAFYIIDRTVPVGFRVGEDENAGKTILVRRYLTE